MNYSVLDDTRCIIGESPVCIDQCILWVDAESDSIYRFNLKSKQTTQFRVDLPVTALAKLKPSGWLAVTKIGIYAMDEGFQYHQYIANPVEHFPTSRPNDGVVSPAGDLWVGTMNSEELESPDGGLFILSRQTLSLSKIDAGFSVANGIAFDKKRHLAYVSNMFKREVYQYQMDSSWTQVLNKKVIVKLPDEDGMPDGLKVDANGTLYICHWDAGLISTYRHTGQPFQRIQLPVKHATRCTFISNDKLAVTTASYEMGESDFQQLPLSGATFQVDLEGAVADTEFEFDSPLLSEKLNKINTT
ncbi:SMP-30/gluconolaconase/LRE domain protein [Vibrio nigripulchritudo ATCC 27043]|uniref:SMP-30/gluconolactonase/LRE family protein n=1 Tax=Vibrio nigripulchritudo TaxID=28173 RepID=UPI00021C1887|nr:SMP-30/gluconolactonase/LRE family protein [Vibrio nigripulchritudo]EGU57592.1 SMP-30/gluconolaconase/LRE domain protein [Vibrio nigripulchritudo ATCC 27043]